MTVLRGTWDRAAASLEGRSVPTWLLGLSIAILAWLPTFAAPFPGLDVSWWSGLYMAAKDHLQFGQEIVFTYGPLGFLKQPWLFYSDLALAAFVYATVVFLAFCTALVWTLRRSIGALPAFLVAFLVVAVLPGIEQAIALALFAAIGILARRPGDRWVFTYAIAGGIWGAAEGLMKLSIGPVVIVVILIGLIGIRPKREQLAAFGLSLIAAGLTFWLLASQSIGALPDFSINAIRITAGYSEGMSAMGEGWEKPVLMAAIAVGSVIWSWFGDFPDRRARFSAALVVAIIAFTSFKQGVIRQDTSHITIFYASMAMVWIAIPVRRRLLPVGLAILAAISLLAIRELDISVRDRINPVDRIEVMADTLELAFGSGNLDEAVGGSHYYSAFWYDIDQRLLDRMLGHGVSVEPWETQAVWAYGLDWSPVPVFQNYSAYTPALDDLNAEKVASDDGPERILQQQVAASIDGRLTVWDAPAQALATLCHFQPAASQPGWVVLKRVPDRCGDQLPAGEADASEGEAVAVPKPGPDEVVLARIDGVRVSGLERLTALLYRPTRRFIETSDGKVIRFIPGLAGQGLLLDSGKALRKREGGALLIPSTRTIAVTGAGDDLHFEFFRMKVD